MSGPILIVPSLKFTLAGREVHDRVIPEETPVALVYDGSTHAVMMATPQDLEDFALGFSLAEGKIESADEIAFLDVVQQINGIELRIWLKPGAGHRIAVRRRALLGPTGCGICGVESLDQALPAQKPVESPLKVSAVEIQAAVASLALAQRLNAEARALHAAGFWTLERGLAALREDVGRHNALDKLAGALSREGIDPATGIVAITSRISVELVQKAANMGAPVLVAISAPTALALRTAEAQGITIVGIARDDSFEVFTHPDRITAEPVRPVRETRSRTETPHYALV
jgi:FdhD protein